MIILREQPELSFDKEKHEYRFKGWRYPSITQAIGEYFKIRQNGVEMLVDARTREIVPSFRLGEAAFFGTDIHLGCELILADNLDWDAVEDEEVLAPLSAFRKWHEDAKVFGGFRLIASERLMFSEKYLYGGMPDIVHFLNGRLCVTEIKTGEAGRSVGPQTAAQAQIVSELIWDDEVGAQPILNAIDRYVIRLRRGSDKIEFNKLIDGRDWAIFMSFLNVHNYLQK